MERMSISDASSHFDELLARVTVEGVTVELEQNNVVVARVSPVVKRTSISELQRIIATLPSLGDDAKEFADDIEAVRAETPQESDPWA